MSWDLLHPTLVLQLSAVLIVLQVRSHPRFLDAAQATDGLPRLPLYGMCLVTRDLLHSQPSLAGQMHRHQPPAAAGLLTAPQQLFLAPRCYCLLSSYPLFDLHVQARTCAVHPAKTGRKAPHLAG